MLRKIPMFVKCYRYLCVSKGLQNTLKMYPSITARQNMNRNDLLKENKLQAYMTETG